MTLPKQIEQAIQTHTAEELALGWLRYEELRKMNLPAFKELCRRNVGGENFDEMVDEILYGKPGEKSPIDFKEAIKAYKGSR